MGKKDVKIVVDYKKGTCEVIGLHKGEVFSLKEPIKGIDKEGKFCNFFSRKMIRMSRKEMRLKLKEMRKSNPYFRYSGSYIRKVDPLIYKALEDWDAIEKTTYATDYLRTVTQDLEWIERPGLPDRVVEEQARRIRSSELLGNGIDIIYNVGMFHTDKPLSFADKRRGIRFAKNHKKLLGVKVQNSLVLKPDYYLDEINQFVQDIQKENEDAWMKHINEVFEEIEEEKKKGEVLKDKEVLAHIERVFEEIEEEKVLAEKLEDKEQLERIRAVLINLERSLNNETVKRRIRETLEKDEARQRAEETRKAEEIRRTEEARRAEEDRKAKEAAERRALEDQKLKQAVLEALAALDAEAEEENVLKDAEVQRRMRESLEREEARRAQETALYEAEVQRHIREALAKEEKKAQENVLKDVEVQKRIRKILDEEEKTVLKKPKVEENKKGKKYKGNKKKRVRNHTGERLSPTKKQRESMARKERKEQNSHYHTQMRLIAEKEEKQRQAAERIAQYQAQKTEETRKLEETKKTEVNIFKDPEVQRRIRESLAKEEARKAEEAKKAEENALKDVEIQRRIRESIAKEEAKIAEETKKLEETDIIEDTSIVELDYWNREIKDKADSIKNKKYIPKAENKTKTLKNFASGKIHRRIQAEIRYWKRKLRDAKDSIKYKKFKPMSYKTRRVIAGAVSLIAVGIIITSSHSSKLDLTEIPNHNGVTVSTSITDPGKTAERNAPEVTPTPTPEATSTPTPEVTPAPEMNDSTGIENGEQTPEIKKPVIEDPSVDENTEGSEIETNVEIDEEKLERFRQEAFQAYQDALIVGETPQIGDILMDQTYSESPSGTGKVGHFASHPDYKISHINIVLREGWKVIRVEGKSLTEILAEYPDYVTYNIGFVDSKTGGGLGFVTREQYEEIVKNRINEIIDSKTDKDLDSLNADEFMR